MIRRPAGPGAATRGIRATRRSPSPANVRRAFEDWRRTSFAERGKLMKQAAAVLRRRQGEFAEIMTAEMGKILKDGRAEVEKCAFNCDHFADAAEKYLAREPVDLGGPKAFVTYNPLGVVLAVMPWNFPFWQVFRFAAPALMAGNGAVLKHASNVPGSALAIEAVFREAGFPEDLFRTVLVPSRDVQALIEDPAIAAVTLTGSVEAGRQVAAAAGAMLKKSVLELGGSDAYLVLEDADIAKAAQVCAAARMVNAGQSCIAGKRFIVVKAVREAFERAFVEAMHAYAMGDPRDDGTKLGPLQSVAARDEMHEQVAGERRGRRPAPHGRRDPGPAGGLVSGDGARPRASRHARVYEEEMFGPVAAIIEATTRRTPSASPTRRRSGSARAC